jgi:hypothetical protein
VAGEGDTPGWDIEYLSEAGELNAVEVKATGGLTKFISKTERAQSLM